VGGAFHLSVVLPQRARCGLEASLHHEGRPAVRASALLIRRADVPVGDIAVPPAIAAVADAEPWQFPFFERAVGYYTSMSCGPRASSAAAAWRSGSG
jgi:hypothetical protein